MKKVVRLTESDLRRLVKRIINEEIAPNTIFPEPLKAKLKRCGGDDVIIGLIQNFPISSQFAMDVFNKKINIFDIPTRLGECTREITQKADSSQATKILGILTCMSNPVF